MDERESEWLERKMVSRHSLEKHKNMERRSDLRVTPTPIYTFSQDFYGLSPIFGFLTPFVQYLSLLGVLSSFEGFYPLFGGFSPLLEVLVPRRVI